MKRLDNGKYLCPKCRKEFARWEIGTISRGGKDLVAPYCYDCELKRTGFYRPANAVVRKEYGSSLSVKNALARRRLEELRDMGKI